MANALVRQDEPMAAQIEQVLVSGDLAALSPAQRVTYYYKVCQSVGLNPLTRPFEYVKFQGQLKLYARRDAADQLRSLHGISLSKPAVTYQDDMVVVTIDASDRTGRTDSDMGAVSIKGLTGEAKANAILKAITKAKRRVTLSISGLGWLDETEIDSIPGAQVVQVDTSTGEILEPEVDFGMGEGAPTEPEYLSNKQLERVIDLAERAYGKDFDEAKLADFISKGAVKKLTELTPKEGDKLIASLQKKLYEASKQTAKEAA